MYPLSQLPTRRVGERLNAWRVRRRVPGRRDGLGRRALCGGAAAAGLLRAGRSRVRRVRRTRGQAVDWRRGTCLAVVTFKVCGQRLQSGISGVSVQGSGASTESVC
jgi:hypothetical protein